MIMSVSGFCLKQLITLTFFSGNCTTGDVQLVGGRNPREGRVEVCVGGHWVIVCHDEWTLREAKVVCRQLNYLSSGSSNGNVHYV